MSNHITAGLDGSKADSAVAARAARERDGAVPPWNSSTTGAVRALGEAAPHKHLRLDVGARIGIGRIGSVAAQTGPVP
ncbi:hypothetical protein [Streptomyces sp. NPDC090112]|uniref:hypothetical protein n=1 Tax=Streptomyces sp. NPDC090112 TaxID=3365949 RepID=UPI0038039CD4